MHLTTNTLDRAFLSERYLCQLNLSVVKISNFLYVSSITEKDGNKSTQARSVGDKIMEFMAIEISRLLVTILYIRRLTIL
jgi:hypothetical protein